MRTIHRGDIIVFKYPGRPEVPFIKRVIAKGGDVVEVINNHVFVNGRMLVEGYARLPDYIKTTYIKPPKLPPKADIPVLPDYLRDPGAFVVQTMPGRTDVTLKSMYENGDPSREKFGPYIIPKGHLFVMGDNRLNSEDSRFWGALDENLVLGRAWLIWWSFRDHEQGFRPVSPGNELKRLWNKAIHFYSRTRWRRILTRPH
ncbi:MAG: signal peptidase I [Acidobacteriota bacterium]